MPQSTPDPSEIAGVIPENTIGAVTQIRYLVLPTLSVEGGHHGNHLPVFKPILEGKLIVTEAGVGLRYFDHTVKNELSILSLV